MINATIILGYDVQGNTSDPAGAGGLVFKGPGTTDYFDPSRKLYQDTGQPFGSAQVVYGVASGSLPPGVHLVQRAPGPPIGFSVSQFGIGGVPTSEGVYTGTFAAVGLFGGDSFTITVTRFGSCPIVSLGPVVLPLVSAGYDQALTPSSGTGPFVYGVISGALPPGISLSSAGVFSGSPTALGYFNVTVRMIDAAGCSAVQSFLLSVIMMLMEVVPNSGSWEGGTAVELHGINLFGVTTVQFGQQEATDVVVVDSETVTAVTPESGTGAAVVYVGLNGITTTVPFTYTAKVSKEFDIRRDPDIQIEAQRNDAPSTAAFTVANEEPLVGTYARIWDPASRKKMHAGTVLRSTQVYKEGDLAWAVSTKDDSWLLDRRRPFGNYANHVPGGDPADDGIPADEVALDILTKYTSGFTFNRVFAGLPKITISFDGTQPLSACLTAICQAAAKSPDAKGGLVWNCDERDILLGYDTGTVEVEDKFSGNATLIFEDEFIGDGVTTSWELTHQLIPPTPFPPPHGWITRYGEAGIIEHGDPLVELFSGLGLFSGRVALPSPAQVPAAPTLVKTDAGSATGHLPMYRVFIRVGFLFDDGTESFASPMSNVLGTSTPNVPGVDTTEGWVATIPIGGAGVIGRRIYLRWGNSNNSSGFDWTTDIKNNTTTTLTADRAFQVTADDYDHMSVHLWNSNPIADGGPFGDNLPPGLNSTEFHQSPEVIWQYDPVTNFITKGAAFAYFASDGQPTMFPLVPTADSIIRVPYFYSNPAGIDTFVLKHDLVLSPVSGLIGPGYVSYNNGFGSVNELITATGGGGAWTYDSITNSIKRELGPPATPQTFWTFSGEQAVPNVVFKYWTGAGVSQQDLNNTLLLQDPPPSKTIELSQVRNRVHVLGVGTNTRTFASAGGLALALEKSDMFLVGGKVRIAEDVYTVDVVGYDPANSYIVFTTVLVKDYPAGTEVRLYAMFEDIDAQEMLAEREDEGNGDGIHETTLSFTSWLISSTIQDTPPGTRAAAEANALASRGIVELATWAWPVESITFATRDVNIKSGAMITWNLLDPPIVGVFKVQSVSIDQIDMMYEDHLVAYEPRFTCKASMVRFEFSDLLRKVLISDSGGGGNTSSSGFGGGSGGVGGGGGATLIPEFWGEVPVGDVDGVNDIYTLPHAYRPGNLAVYENGVRQLLGQDFFETSDSSFTMVDPPKAGSRIVCDSRGY